MVKQAAGVVLVAVILAAVPGTAAATVHETLDYTCSYSIASEPMVAQLSWTGPSLVLAGRPTPDVLIDAVATVPADVTGALAMDGAATVEGTVDATGTVVAPEGNIDTGMQLTVPRFTVPALGDMAIPAHGKTPALVFHRTGRATIAIGGTLTMHLLLRQANGDPAMVSQADLSCTLNSGQHTELYSFDIVSPAPPPGSPTGKAGTPAVPGTNAPGRNTATPSGSPASPTSPPPSSMVVAGTAPSPAVSANPAAGKADNRGVARTSADIRPIGPAGTAWGLAAAAIVLAGLGMMGGGWWLMRRRARRLPTR